MIDSNQCGNIRAILALGLTGLTGLARHQGAARFRYADHVESPSRELAKLVRDACQKVSGYWQIGRKRLATAA